MRVREYDGSKHLVKNNKGREIEMARAKTLFDLLKVRAANRDFINNISGNLGSALGFKYQNGQPTKEPAILIFVEQKMHNEWLPVELRIPPVLSDDSGLFCRTDVIQSESKSDYYLKIYDWQGGDIPPQWNNIISTAELVSPPPLSRNNMLLLETLHGASTRIPVGGRLAVTDEDGNQATGTLGCFVTDNDTGNLGILTNSHVANSENSQILFPWFNGAEIGDVKLLRSYLPDETRFNGEIDAPNTIYTLDCAFIELRTTFLDSIEPNIPSLGRIGPPLPLALNTMGPVGKRVVGVGARRGLQRGTLVAFAYESFDGEKTYCTDYLIVGDEQTTANGIEVIPTAFSNPGDSGKLIVSDDENRNALALLWGGDVRQMRPGKQFEDWSYAIDINLVCEQLGVTIFNPEPNAIEQGEQAMSDVTLTQDTASTNVTIKAKLNNEEKYLSRGVGVVFENVPSGATELLLNAVTGVQSEDFTVTLHNAVRPHFGNVISDTAYVDQAGVFPIDIEVA